MLKYTHSHEWIQVRDDEIGIVGLSLYVQKELSEVVYIDLPKVGRVVCADEAVAVLESTKAAIDIYTPVSGLITRVHSDLQATPSLIHQWNKREEGWLFEIELHSPAELLPLLSPEEYAYLSRPSKGRDETFRS